MELKLCVPSVLLCLLSTKEIGTIYLVGITYIVEIRISNLALSLLDDDDRGNNIKPTSGTMMMMMMMIVTTI